MDRHHPTSCLVALLKNVLLVYLPSLRHLDLGVDYHLIAWPSTNAIVPLTYIRANLQDLEMLVELMSTSPLSGTLQQLHVKVHYSFHSSSFPESIRNLSIEMINLHTLTVVQDFFCEFTVGWTSFEILTSSKVMPVLRRANIALVMNINDFSSISSAPLFIDHRRVDVNFAFNFINCPRYDEMTQFVPRGSRFHPREIVGATFVVNGWRDRSEWLPDGDPYVRFYSTALLLRFCYWIKYRV